MAPKGIGYGRNMKKNVKKGLSPKGMRTSNDAPVKINKKPRKNK